MLEAYEARTARLRKNLAEVGLDAAILTDADSISYFAGYWNYLGIDFGRPTLLIIPAQSDPLIITPLMESDMCGQMTWIRDIRPWSDGVMDEWRGVLRSGLERNPCKRVGIETRTIPALIAHDLLPILSGTEIATVDMLIANLRAIKSPDEIVIMRQAGQVAIAMVEGAKGAIGEGVPEYEVALAVIAAGTRKAASLLDTVKDRFTSPAI